jgi:hypothetical protein
VWSVVCASTAELLESEPDLVQRLIGVGGAQVGELLKLALELEHRPHLACAHGAHALYNQTLARAIEDRLGLADAV